MHPELESQLAAHLQRCASQQAGPAVGSQSWACSALDSRKDEVLCEVCSVQGTWPAYCSMKP